MTEPKIGVPSLAFAEKWVEEDESLQWLASTRRSWERACRSAPAPAPRLRLLAAAIGARAVVEVGTGAGTSGIWLLRGMRPDGVLTTVDIEGEHQRLAKQAYTEAGIAPNRYRLINGSAADVLPRLTDGAYDLVFVDADKTGYVDYLEQAMRLLRPGGVVAFDNALRRTRSPTRPCATWRRSPCASWCERCTTTTGWCRRCCRSATDCWWPSPSPAAVFGPSLTYRRSAAASPRSSGSAPLGGSTSKGRDLGPMVAGRQQVQDHEREPGRRSADPPVL